MTLVPSKIMDIALSGEDSIIKEEQLKVDITNPSFQSRILRFVIYIEKFKTYFSDKEILEIASNPETSPIWPFDLKDEVKISDLRGQVIRFAKRIQREKLATGEIN